MDEAEVRRQLKSWIVDHAKSSATHLADDTRILDEGILSSLDIVEFVLYIESLRGQEVNVEDIEPEVFTSVDSLYAAFFRA
jgi:acyl carrier protein